MKLSKALSHAFGREEEGTVTVLGDIEACLTRNLCECILHSFMAKYAAFRKMSPDS